LFDPPIYVNVRDRVTPLRALVAWLERAGHQRIVLLDNASTYEPCVEYLKATPHDVVCLGANLGSQALWRAGLQPNGWYVYTDPDVLPTPLCPLEAVAHLRDVLDRHSGYSKAGLGLYLDDVPETMPSLWWERRLLTPHPDDSWPGELEPGVYGSLIDTTFALYRPGMGFTYRAIRCGAPYQARHASWYVTEPGEEDRYYLDHALQGREASSWATWPCA